MQRTRGRFFACAAIAVVLLACTPIADIAKDPTLNPDAGGDHDASNITLDGGITSADGSVDAWPDATSTGWAPTGVTLTRHDGDLIVTTPGTIVDSIDLYGTLYARAANVTFSRSRVHGQIDNESADRTTIFPGLLVQDVEIDGSPFVAGVSAYQAPIGRSRYTAQRCNVHDWGLAFHIGDDVVLEDNYVHAIVSENSATSGSSSNYAATSNGGGTVVIRHNNLQCLASNCQGALALFGDTAVVNDVLVQHNLINGGTQYCVYGGSVTGKPFPQATNTRFVDNHFGRVFAAKCATDGPVIDFDSAGAGNQWSGNVWDDSGQIISP